MTKNYKYNAFFSYAHEDKLTVSRLQNSIENKIKIFFVIKKLRIFRDELDHKHSEGLPKSIKSGIDSSEFLVIFISLCSKKSRWVNDEISHWTETKRDHNKIILILLEGKLSFQTNLVLGKKTYTPVSIILPIVLTNMSFDEEIIFVDLRIHPNEGTKEREIIFFEKTEEIVARLKKLSVRELRGDDRKRLLTFISFSFIITLSFGVIAWYALVSADNAKLEANNAKSLYWVSESRNLNYIQSLRLLVEAKKIASTSTINQIDNELNKIFNSSNEHNFNDKLQFIDYHSEFSLDSKWFVYTSFENSVSILNLEDCTSSIIYESKNSKITDISFLSNSKFIYISYKSVAEDESLENNYAYLYDIDRKKGIALSNQPILNILFSEDGNWLYVQEGESRFILWDLIKRSRVKAFNTSTCPDFPESVINDKGRLIISSLNAENTEAKYQIKEYSKDGNWLIVSNHMLVSPVTKVINTKTKEIKLTLLNDELTTERGFSIDNNFYYSRNDDYGFKIFDLRINGSITFDKFKSYKILTTNKSKVMSLFNKEDHFLAWFSLNGEWIKSQNNHNYNIFNLKTGKRPAFLRNENDFREISFSEDNKYLVTIDHKNLCKIWELASGKFIAIDYFKNGEPITRVGLSPDNRWLCVGDDYGLHELYNISSKSKPDFINTDKHIMNITFSANCRWVKVGYSNESRLYNLESTSFIEPVFTFNSDIKKYKFSETNRYCTVITNDSIVLWTLKGDHFSLLSSTVENSTVSYIEFSNDKKLSITFNTEAETKSMGYRDAYQKTWDLKTNRELKTKQYLDGSGMIEYEKDYPYFSRNKKWKATKGYSDDDSDVIDGSGVIQVFDNKSKKKLGFLSNLLNISDVDFTFDSKYLSIVDKHCVSTWDLDTGKNILNVWVTSDNPKISYGGERDLYIFAGSSIIKMNIHNQRGNYFSFGDKSPFNYSSDEIYEWIKTFGNKYLLPLDGAIKKKYDIK